VIIHALQGSGESKERSHAPCLESFGWWLGIELLPGIGLLELDVVRMTEGFGCDGMWAERPENLREALRRPFDASRPYVLAVTVDPAAPQVHSRPGP
jgi:hypothetical protein